MWFSCKRRLYGASFCFYWQWRPQEATVNVRMQVNMEIILSICILQVFCRVLISINFSFLTLREKLMKLAKGRERCELCRGNRKQQELHFTPSGFFCDIDVNLREKGKTYSSIRVFLSSPTHVQNFSLLDFLQCQFACVQGKKEVNAHMRKVLRNWLLKQWNCVREVLQRFFKRRRRSENHLNGTLRSLLEIFFLSREWSGNDVN